MFAKLKLSNSLFMDPLQFLLGLPKTPNGVEAEQVLTNISELQDMDQAQLTPWQASHVYHTLTHQKNVIASKDLLALVRLALSHIVGDNMDISRSEKLKEDLYRVMDALVPPAEESVEDVLAPPKYAWQDKVAKLPQSWPVLMQGVDTLQVSSKRASVLKHVPDYKEITRVPTNNAPHTPQGDSEKAAWDRQVRDAMRVLATAKLLGDDPRALHASGVEPLSPECLLDTTFALLASLSHSI